MKAEFALAGLHQFVEDAAERRTPLAGRQVVELGAGSGAFTDRLLARGAAVTASDLNDGAYALYDGGAEFVQADLDRPDFATALGGPFDVVFAIELIEHLESPLSFLRNVGDLLTESGTAYVTTPNVDNLASRLRFLRGGQLRGASEHDDPGHISPIHTWILLNRLLPRTSLELAEIIRFPPEGFSPGPGWKRRLAMASGPVLSRFGLAGDINLFVLRRRPAWRATDG